MTNKFLLAGNKFMLGMHLRQPGFTYSPLDHLLKIKKLKKFKNLKKLEIKDTFIKTNSIKLAFKMICLWRF